MQNSDGPLGQVGESSQELPSDFGCFFDVYFELAATMQSALLAAVAVAPMGPAEAPTVAHLSNAHRDPVSPRESAVDSGRSWYRAPVETPFGSYMQGSGAFVPSDLCTSMATAFWQPHVDATTRHMLGGGHGMPTMPSFAALAAFGQPAWMMGVPMAWTPAANFTPFAPAAAPMAMWSEFANFLPNLFQAAQASIDPTVRAMGTSGTPAAAMASETDAAPFASYRSSGGHASASVISSDKTALLATLPLSAALIGLELVASFAPAVTPLAA